MRRQRDTLELAARAAGWPPEYETDPRWNEFSHAGPLGQPGARERHETDVDYARRVDESIDRWFAGTGEPPGEPRTAEPGTVEPRAVESGTVEPFGAFMSRVVSALEAAPPGPGETHIVFTSSGVIAVVAAHLLGEAVIWPRLNRVAVNSGVTKVVIGRRGMSLVSFNDHSHLAPEAVTYR